MFKHILNIIKNLILINLKNKIQITIKYLRFFYLKGKVPIGTCFNKVIGRNITCSGFRCDNNCQK